MATHFWETHDAWENPNGDQLKEWRCHWCNQFIVTKQDEVPPVYVCYRKEQPVSLATTGPVSLAIRVLNEITSLDRNALEALVEYRVPCNSGLTGHPTVQVVQVEGRDHVGFLGILNGIFGARVDGIGHITAVFEDDGTLLRFEKTK